MGGHFDPRDNSIHLGSVNLYATSQELFHAFQIGEHGGYDLTADRSNIETEGDVMSMYVMWESGGAQPSIPWADNLVTAFGGIGEVPSSSEIGSVEYFVGFLNAVTERIDHYKNQPNAHIFQGYTKDKSWKGPDATIEVFKQSDPNLVGPRLESGEFYSEP
jgi:hypothetical protein